MNTTISTTINECPIDITVEFSYNHTWLTLYVEEIDKEFFTKRPNVIQVDEIDYFDYAIDILTEEIEASLHQWLIHNSDDVYYWNKFNLIYERTTPYTDCKSEDEAKELVCKLNAEYYD
jgi:hypothetical protein